MYISSISDLSNSSTLPNNVVTVPAVDRQDSSEMSKLSKKFRRFITSMLPTAHGAGISKIFAGGSIGMDALSQIIQLFEEQPMQQQQEDYRITLQKLIGEQQYKQIMASLKQQYENELALAEQQQGYDDKARALDNPAVQRALAMTSLLSDKSDQAGPIVKSSDQDIVNPPEEDVSNLPPRYSSINPPMNNSGASSLIEDPTVFGGPSPLNSNSLRLKPEDVEVPLAEAHNPVINFGERGGAPMSDIINPVQAINPWAIKKAKKRPVLASI